MRCSSGLSTLKKEQIPERGARMARRDERAYREYVTEEQRSQAGCPARKMVLLQRRQVTRLLAATFVLFASMSAFAQGPTYRLGTTPSEEEIKARDTAVSPQGKELPLGSGTVKEGAAVYAQKCEGCHGPNGKGTRLHRGLIPLGNAKPVKIEGSLVPYATTVWDFINRAMPSTRPGSLTPNEVYASTAFVLFLNGIITETDVLDATTLPKVRMPNRDNFLAVEINWKPGQRRPLGHYP